MNRGNSALRQRPQGILAAVIKDIKEISRYSFTQPTLIAPPEVVGRIDDVILRGLMHASAELNEPVYRSMFVHTPGND
jgi:hypothetical protein